MQKIDFFGRDAAYFAHKFGTPGQDRDLDKLWRVHGEVGLRKGLGWNSPNAALAASQRMQ